MEICMICKEKVENKDASVYLRAKGSQTINEASCQRGDSLHTSPGDLVHQECRRKYCNPNVIKRDINKVHVSSNVSRLLRSMEPPFLFSENCLFCGQYAKNAGRKRGCDVFPVRTKDFQETIESICKQRGDDWGEKVQGRIVFGQDLHAVDAIYHQSCNVNFRTMKDVPRMHQDDETASKQFSGRPVNSDQIAAFLKVTDYLAENDDEQVTVKDLVEKMKDFSGDDAYSAVYMKKKLLDHYGNSIIITEINGKSNVVTFRNTASSILQCFYQRPAKEDTYTEKMHLIETAAKLIKSDIKSMKTSKCVYPAPCELSSIDSNLSDLPETLQVLLRTLFSEKNPDVKIASLGQAIVQATRPRVLISPLQIGLAVELHHHFGSKFLIDTLNSLGFCSSYSEVKKFEVSAAVSQGTDIPGLTSGHFVQFIADNVDHNIRTLDGHNTFHGMGIIAGVTPGTKRQRPVPRISGTSQDLIALGKIGIHFYKAQFNYMSRLTYEKLHLPTIKDSSWKLDLLSKLSWNTQIPTPGWSGLMQMVQQGFHPGQSSIHFLPMIDMNPSDLTCIYSTLMFVSAEAKRYGLKAVLTFDQPLFWKATTIIINEPVDSELRSVVLRLGGFHIQMSFLGSIGHLMSGSGLSEVLETVFASNAVGHMMTGKSVSRAVRGHMLVDTALNAMMFAKMYGKAVIEEPHRDKTLENSPGNQELESLSDVSLLRTEQPEVVCSAQESDSDDDALQDTNVTKHCTDELSEAIHLYETLLNGDTSAEVVYEHTILDKINEKFVGAKKSLIQHRTASLWLQYMEMIDILRKFIKAERTGNWRLHLQSVQEMLPYFAAAGHNFYVKSAYIYLQNMQVLERDHPDVHLSFESGNHVLRRSDRFWAGLSTDLVIEQVLMRSIKTTGGLTRGRGMTESQQAQWLLARPACADINNAMQQFTDTEFYTSEQHKENTQARKSRDHKDTLTFLSFFQDRNPFDEDHALRNIATGVTADAKVNVEKSKEVGLKVLKTMASQNVLNYTFKKANQAVTLSTKTAVKIDGEAVQVDPQLLFQRLITAADGISENISEIFSYELCGVPSSLFDTSGLLREAHKPVLADAIWTVGGLDMPQPSVDIIDNAQYVLDGGSVLQRIPWSHGSNFISICNMYVEYVKKYSHPTIVFDGYSAGPSTKDTAHLRRTGGRVGPEVKFTEDMFLKSKKEQFLANSTNKQRFINLLSGKMEENGIKTVHAVGDADLLIVQTTVSAAAYGPTVLVGEDTDLLVLLCHHADLNSSDIFFKSDSKQTASKKKRIWSIKWIKQKLGPEVCHLLPFVHAITGCDTTSRLFGIGKGIALKKLRTDPHFKHQAEIFARESPKMEVVRAGEEALSCLYGGTPGESLDLLRYRKFCTKVMTDTVSVQVHILPPTSAAASYHSQRTYLQVQQWRGIGNNLIPRDWGWDTAKDKLQPILTHLPPAPEKLLKIIRCNCKTDCDNKRCNCKKHGLQCSVACGDCRGVSCSNAPSVAHGDLHEET